MCADGSVDLEVGGGRKRARSSLPNVVVVAGMVAAMAVCLVLALVFSQTSSITVLQQAAQTQQLPVIRYTPGVATTQVRTADRSSALASPTVSLLGTAAVIPDSKQLQQTSDAFDFTVCRTITRRLWPFAGCGAPVPPCACSSGHNHPASGGARLGIPAAAHGSDLRTDAGSRGLLQALHEARREHPDARSATSTYMRGSEVRS